MGETFAMLSAILWAGAVILFKKSGESVSPFSLNLFRVVISMPLFFLTLFITRTPLRPDVPVSDYMLLFCSGVIGIAVSDTFFHLALNRIGAGLTAIVDCLYSPFVVIFAFLMLGERLGGWELAGMLFVIGGVLVAARMKLPRNITRMQLVMGIIWGGLAMATVAFGIVLAKQVLERNSLIWVMVVRQLSCMIVMLPVAMLLPKRREIFAVFKPRATWKYSLSGSVMGSYLALTFWIAGMKYIEAGSAAILNQTSTIFILLLATVFLGERFDRRKAVASILAVAGIVMVTLGG